MGAHDEGMIAVAEMLIDRYLPTFDTTVIEHEVVDANVPATWSALTELDLAQVHTPLLDAAMFVRGVPARVARLAGAEPPEPEPAVELKLGADGPGLDGWMSLGGAARTLVSYEARTATTDAQAAHRFARYWRLVRPFVGQIMRAALSTLADDAAAGRSAPVRT